MAWIEEINKRDKKCKHFVDDIDPTHHYAKISLHDQHYLDDSLSWQEVDETIVDDSSIPGYVAKCDKQRHIIRFGSGGERRWYPRREVTTEYADTGKPDYWAGNRWRVWNLTGLIRGINTVVWETTDYKVTITNKDRRVKLEYILKTSSAYSQIRFPLDLTGLTWDNGNLIGEDSQIAGVIQYPTAKDTNGTRLTCTGIYSGGYYEINCDVTSAVYPVIIDPTFSTRGDYLVLPTNDDDLETAYSASDYTDVSSHNETYVDQTGQLQHMIHEFKDYVGSEPNCRLTAILQTDLDTALSHLYLDIYNYHDSEWNNLAEENDVGADTDITFDVIVSDLSNFKDGSDMMCCRIRQEAI